jgi:hypothetical protein
VPRDDADKTGHLVCIQDLRGFHTAQDRCNYYVLFFNSPNPFRRNMALGSTQPLTEMCTRNLPGGKGGPARKADNLIAICEPIV